MEALGDRLGGLDQALEVAEEHIPTFEVQAKHAPVRPWPHSLTMVPFLHNSGTTNALELPFNARDLRSR